jgi:hypothetical protein
MEDETSPIERFGDDSFNVHKVREIILIILTLIVIGWYTFNYPKLIDKAKDFERLGIIGAVGVLAGFVVMKTPMNLNVPLSEKPLFPVFTKKILLAFSLIIGIVTFVAISASPYSIEAPTFQIVDLGTFGEALLDAAAAITEDIVFFAVVPGITFTIVYYASKSPILALIFVLILSPSVFLVYHTLHYGFTDVVASTAVFFFGLEMTAWMIVMREIFYCHMRHIGNNLGKLIFTSMSFETFVISILTSLWTWIIVAAIVVILVVRFKNRGK